MKDVSPDELPFELYEELYLPGRGCWKHHYSVLTAKKLLHLEPLLEKAGIEIKHSRFTDEEDKIILRNWDNIKDELGYNEQDDARSFVGFGMRLNKEEVAEYVQRAKESNFNQRMCEGLLHRNAKDVRERFKRLFEPKMVKLRLNQTSYQLCRPGSSLIVKKDDKRRIISEGGLKQVVKAMKEADYNISNAVKLLSNSWGEQWTIKSITNIIERMARFSGDPLTKKEWIPFYHVLVRELMAAEKITDFELVRIFENQEYDWKTKVPWFSVALHTIVSHTKKTLLIAWELILVELRKLLSELRMNGKPFAVYRLSEYIVNGSGFDEWRREKEAQVGEMTDDEARKVFEIVVNEKNKEVNRLQQLTNSTKRTSTKKDKQQCHFFCRFKNGELTWVDKKNRLSAEMAISVDVFDSDEDDGPLQDPVRLVDCLNEKVEVEGNAAEIIDHNVKDHSENSRQMKKRKIRLSEGERTEGEDIGHEVSSPKKKKRKKIKMEESEMIEENRDDIEKIDENIEEDDGAEKEHERKKKNKKKKKRKEMEENGDDIGKVDEHREEDDGAERKKKNKKEIEENKEENISGIGEHSEREEKERKKKKKKKKKREEMEENEEDVEKLEESIIPAEVSEKKEKKKKKKRVSLEE